MHSSYSIFLVVSIIFSSTLIDAVTNPITRPIISFCAGESHICAVFDTKQMKCFGFRGYIGTPSDYGDSPSNVGDNAMYFDPGTGLSITQVSCQFQSTCMLLNTGNIKCVGYNDFGQTGLGNTVAVIGPGLGYAGDTLPVVNLGTGVTVKGVFGGFQHVCVSTTDNKVKCHGRNYAGQLGYEDTTNRGASASDMGENLNYLNFGANVEIDSFHTNNAADHSCIILSKPTASAQRIKCWGLNDQYQLGYGDTENRGDASGEMGDKLPLINLGTESRVKQLAIGSYHTCGLLINDIFKCWGATDYGQIGTGAIDIVSSVGNSLPSVLIDSGKKVKLFTTGYYHTCIVYEDLITMKCVGDNYYGQLGQADKVGRGVRPETTIPNISAIDLGTGSLKISSIYGGGSYSCVMFSDYSFKCFGLNDYGQFAIGSKRTIGDESYEMGTNLTFAEIFSPTQSPSRSPTPPTQSPSQSPSKSPTPPTLPTILPTKAPTKPSKSPSRSPTSKPTNVPVPLCTYDSKKKCKKDKLCEWKSQLCSVVDCPSIVTRPECKAHAVCKWKKDACITK